MSAILVCVQQEISDLQEMLVEASQQLRSQGSRFTRDEATGRLLGHNQTSEEAETSSIINDLREEINAKKLLLATLEVADQPRHQLSRVLRPPNRPGRDPLLPR